MGTASDLKASLEEEVKTKYATWEDQKTSLYSLKEEYDKLEESDPRKVELHKQISEGLAGTLSTITKQAAGADDPMKVMQDFASEMETQGIGASFRTGTPEYTTALGGYEAASTLEAGIAEGIKASTEQVGLGLEAIGAGAEAAKEEFAVGEAKTLDAIAAGEQAALSQIGVGKEGMEQAWEEGVAGARAGLDPYAQAGERALGKYEQAMGITEGFDQATLENLPGYQARLKEGLESVKGAAAARGGALGGRALKELQTRGEGIASQEFGRYVAGLSDITGKGQAAATSLAQIGMMGAQGKSSAAQFAAAASAGITMDATGKSIAAVGMGTTGRAGVEMSAASAEAALYGQNASTMASLYGTQATTGAGMAMSVSMQQSQMQWQRMEADLARQMSKWSGGQQLFGSFLSLAGTIGGAYLGGPARAARGGAITG